MIFLERHFSFPFISEFIIKRLTKKATTHNVSRACKILDFACEGFHSRSSSYFFIVRVSVLCKESTYESIVRMRHDGYVLYIQQRKIQSRDKFYS